MEITLKKLIAQTGDSTLRSYSFNNGLLVVSLELYDGRDVRINIPTTVVRGEQISTERIRYTFLKLDELEGMLKINKDGFYVPSSDFGRMMKEVRSGVSLAYGQRATEIKWLLSVTKNHPRVVCTVAEIDQITWLIDE